MTIGLNTFCLYVLFSAKELRNWKFYLIQFQTVNDIFFCGILGLGNTFQKFYQYYIKTCLFSLQYGYTDRFAKTFCFS